jgi:GT2 family glycosyltransferase
MPNVSQYTDWKLKAPKNLLDSSLLPSRTTASIVIVSYNSRSHLETCLNSVCCTVGLDCEVIVVDNASTDGSARFVAERFPLVKLIRNRKNTGFAAANNKAVRAARGRYIVALNPDTEVERGWLDALLKPYRAETPRHISPVGMTTPRILLSDRRDRVNTCGNAMHFTGITVCRGLGLPADAVELAEPCDVPAVSGACFAMTRDLWERLGGLDESFFTYLEDTDLSLRARLAGYRCVYSPGAVVYHSYTGSFSARKLYYLERNRMIMLMKCYRPETLRAMWPALVLAEVIGWGYALKSGGAHVRAKMRAHRWLAQHKSEIKQKYDQTQRYRVKSDADLLRDAGATLDMQQLAGARLGSLAGAVLNPVFRLWKGVVRACID